MPTPEVTTEMLLQQEPTARKDLVASGYLSLAKEDKKQVQEQLGLGRPGTAVNDAIWLMVVGGIVLVIIIAVAAFAVRNSLENLLAVFTAGMGFLGGLFTQSPIDRGTGGR